MQTESSPLQNKYKQLHFRCVPWESYKKVVDHNKQLHIVLLSLQNFCDAILKQTKKED